MENDKEGHPMDEKEKCFNFVLRLHCLNLITYSERLHINSKRTLAQKKAMLLDIMKKKNWMTSVKILRELNNGDNGTNYTDYELYHDRTILLPITNPMEVDVVIRKIYGYLNLDDIKSCRLLNKKWNKVSIPLLEKRSKINFVCSYEDYEGPLELESLRTTSNFIHTFNNSLLTVNFDSFEFNSSSGQWPIDELTQFFLKVGKSVKELTFGNTVVKIANNEAPFDISPWIAESQIRQLNIWNHYNSRKLRVCLDQLNYVKYLTLQLCDVIITESSKVSPIHLNICSVRFHRDGQKLSRFLVNKAVDFKDINKIYLSCKPSKGDTALVLDVGSSIHVDLVELDRVSVINNSVSHWTVNTLKMMGMTFTVETPMIITRLEFGNGEIDLYALPQSLEILCLWNGPDNRTAVTCSNSLFLPNLKQVKLVRLASCCEHFSNCPNVSDMEISRLDGDQFEIAGDALPVNIKNLRLTDMEVARGEKSFQLDKLILKNYSFIHTDEILSFFEPKELVLRWSSDGTYETNESVFQFINNKELQTITVGPFDLGRSYGTSRFFTRCDINAKYYLFEKSPGEEDYQGEGLTAEEEMEFFSLIK